MVIMNGFNFRNLVSWYLALIFFFLSTANRFYDRRKENTWSCNQVCTTLSSTFFSRAPGFVVQWESRPTHLGIIHYSLVNNVGICRYRLHRKLLIEKVIQALDIYQERILFWSWNSQIFRENETVLFGCNAPKSPLLW